MNIPEEFGKYLLLKKLTEDPLGETFRAGRWGQEGMEQVVLLRVFNGKGLDGEKLWQKISSRADIQNALKSPNIGNGVDLDRVRSYPYTAYDYISGKNLASLFDQASRQFSPIPADHALLIAERISLALAAAYETRVQDERVLHGFVVPHLVMISNEGETRLLGFEAAPGLRESWRDRHGMDAEMGRYVAPEALSGAPVSKTDDVYSLGAILFELLTGEHLPVIPATQSGTVDYSAVIDNAVLGNEGTPFPPAVAALLKKSLVGRDQRIADAATWHKTLSKLMIDGHYSPTTFNLAFFMHGLFREEIERESQEIQAEKTLQLPRRTSGAFPMVTMAGAATQAMPAVQPGPSAAPAAAHQSVRETAGVREVTLPGVVPAAASAEPSKKGLWIGLAAGLLVIAGAGGYFLLGSTGSKERTAAAQPMPTPTTASMPGPVSGPGLQDPAAAPAGPTPEELKAQIQQMLDAQSQEMEAKLKTQYDDRIKQLQSQLEDSRKTANEQERARAAAERERERAAVVPSQPQPAPAISRPEPAPPQAQPQQQAAPAPVQPAPAEEERPASQPAQQPASALTPVPQTPARPQVQYGDLVQGGTGVTPPKVRSQPTPRYPVAAQRFNKAAVVQVRVLVDEKGQVTAAEQVGGKAGFGFDDAAVETARRTSFNPATKDGVRVKMWTVLKIAFKP